MPTHFNGTLEEKRALDVYIKLSRASESCGLRINAHLQRYNLTVSQFGALEALYHLGPMQPGELGAKILKSSGNMTTVIDNLEKRGLVERHRQQDDRRCISIHLTRAGEDLITEILPDHIKGVVETVSILSEEEQAQLGDLCRKLGLGKG